MNHIDKENILPTPEPSSDAYNGLDEGVRKYAPARKPALKMAYMKPALNSTAEIGKSDQFGGLERLAELAGLATPPPSSPVRSQSPMRALASSPPSLPDFSSRIHSQSRGAVALSRGECVFCGERSNTEILQNTQKQAAWKIHVISTHLLHVHWCWEEGSRIGRRAGQHGVRSARGSTECATTSSRLPTRISAERIFRWNPMLNTTRSPCACLEGTASK